jgi:rfaE bifunctional protein nucleotidyltransferase chain/domain
LHSGHIAFLREARRLGDVLIVGINSDEGLRRRTGQSPLNPEEERLAVVAALDSVDHTVLFEEDTPSALIREIRPHIHVKGGDYRADDLPEAEAVREVGAELVILPLVEPRISRLLEHKIARATRRTRSAA